MTDNSRAPRPGTVASGAAPPSRASGLLLGLGLGGFVDGIVLHQILQWHHMVSHVPDYPMSTVAGLEVNTLADGFFHAATWLLVLAGSISTVVAWRRGRLAPSWGFHVGLVLAGWGLFNVVEGLVDHHLLGVHHVRDDLGAPLAWDLGFLALGVLLVVVGWLLHQRGRSAMLSRAAGSASSVAGGVQTSAAGNEQHGPDTDHPRPVGSGTRTRPLDRSSHRKRSSR